MKTTIITIMANLLFTCFMPLIMVGLIKKVKAFFARRKGTPLLQVVYDVRRLLLKGELIIPISTLNIASSISLGALLVSSLFIPQVTGRAIINNMPYDFIIFIYLFGLSRFFNVINSMQSGSSFEGMGCSRELIYSISGEFCMITSLVTLAIYSKSTTFAGIFAKFNDLTLESATIAIITTIVLFVLMLLEGCRVPIDDPTTHLELTMIHEVMILDNSGISLAYLTYSGMLKIYLFASIISSLLLAEVVQCQLMYPILFVIMLLFLAKVIGFIESTQARLRMVLINQYLLFAGALATILLATVIMKGR